MREKFDKRRGLYSSKYGTQDRLPAFNRVKLGAKAKTVIRGRGSPQSILSILARKKGTLGTQVMPSFY